MTGVLFGLGLGPGDPELITLKAARLIAACPVVAYPALAGADSFARSIAAGLIGGDVREIVMDVPMTTAREPAQAAYDTGAAAIAAELEAGRDVVCLCEGDPFFYGSFMYLFARLSGRFRVEVVPGVTSLTACAARAGLPLAARNERLTVLPGPLPEAELEARIEGAESVAILKVGRHLPKLRAVIDRLGLMDRAVYVERATLAGRTRLPAGRGAGHGAVFLDDPADQGGRSMAVAPVVLALSRSGEPVAHRVADALALCRAWPRGPGREGRCVLCRRAGSRARPVRRRDAGRRRLRQRHPDPGRGAAAGRQAGRAAGDLGLGRRRVVVPLAGRASRRQPAGATDCRGAGRRGGGDHGGRRGAGRVAGRAARGLGAGHAGSGEGCDGALAGEERARRSKATRRGAAGWLVRVAARRRPATSIRCTSGPRPGGPPRAC